MASLAALADRVAQGAGRRPADLVIKNARLFDLVTGALTPSDIAIADDTIVGTYGVFDGLNTLDARGLVAVPGFIDTHFHCESSLLTPRHYEEVALRHGVTSGIWDPHEIANVLGVEGLRWALESAAASLFDFRVQLSSCVPATTLETAGARLEAEDLVPLLAHPKALGLAEVMNFPGVIGADPGLLAKIAAFAGRPIDGHSPLLTGQGLNAYLAAGITTDHETTTAQEAMEKLRKGMAILIREGSVSKDLHALAPLIGVETAPFLAFCTDDRNPLDVAEEGHLDFVIRTAIALGASPLAVYRAATVSAARLFGLHDRGFLAPGRRADVVLIDSLESCRVREVVVGGRPVTEALLASRAAVPPIGLASVRLPGLDASRFEARPSTGSVPVIGVIPGKIITEHLALTLPRDGDGRPLPDPAQDVVKVAVVERHGRNGNIAVGFVRGFGLREGAIASSVGHDSHNITVVGVDAADMALAVGRVGALQGGFVVASGGAIRAELALPVAGLMSLEPAEPVRRGLVALREAARALGCTLPEPFLQVAFLPLPVIPHLKITDRGMVDVDRFALIA